MPSAKTNPSLDDDEILKAEFEYIADTAFQANEDRARVSSFYLLAVGSLVAALFSTQLLDNRFDPVFLSWAFSGLFLVLTLLGTLTTLQLARLRAAWYDSMLALNQIKDYWQSQAKDKHLKQAFKWDTESLPNKYKANSVSFYQTLEVALLSGITFGAAVYFFQSAINYNCPVCNWAYTISLGLFAFLSQLWMYKLNLDK